ncbi:hypothetical protein A7D21_15565 [Pseudomonas sp. AP19]|uniref:DUF6166 domain-containing protein n=1 Tax=Pseudomonas TaxID=286 RepID=UPI00084AB606|nr:DUF6166 domain-containing protein [Pseudomonas sp. AP19]OEC73804.1 hypothetical protein A7D21_15565 [Pseudomonas sp. AP19]
MSYKQNENGYTGETRSKALLSNDFWILTRSVDADSADIIVQEKQRSKEHAIHNRAHTPALGYVQSKYFEGHNQVKIHRNYVDDPITPFRKGYFALIHTNDEHERHVHYFFTAQDIQTHWYFNDKKDHYCFSLTADRDYSEFKNLLPKAIREQIQSGIKDLKYSVESLIWRDFIALNSNTRCLGSPAGQYILTRPHGCPTAIYVAPNGQASPLDPRKDLFPYSGFFEWGYNGTGPNFLAISLLAHFFGGDIPDNDSIDALKYNLISHLERFNKDDIIIDSDRILRALAYVPDSPVDLNSHPTLLSLYNEAQNRYKKYV